MIKLTKTNGRVVWINPFHILTIEEGHDYTVVRLAIAGLFYTVKETPEEVVREIER